MTSITAREISFSRTFRTAFIKTKKGHKLIRKKGFCPFYQETLPMKWSSCTKWGKATTLRLLCHRISEISRSTSSILVSLNVLTTIFSNTLKCNLHVDFDLYIAENRNKISQKIIHGQLAHVMIHNQVVLRSFEDSGFSLIRFERDRYSFHFKFADQDTYLSRVLKTRRTR